MRKSLQSTLPALSKIVGASYHVLYERQRELVRCGLLDAADGKGPGSGVFWSPRALALILTCVLSTDHLNKAAHCTASIAKARPTNRKCPLTAKGSFIQAFTDILQNLPGESVSRIIVSRTSAWACIEFQEYKLVRRSEFGRLNSGVPIAVEASLCSSSILNIIDGVRA